MSKKNQVTIDQRILQAAARAIERERAGEGAARPGKGAVRADDPSFTSPNIASGYRVPLVTADQVTIDASAPAAEVPASAPAAAAPGGMAAGPDATAPTKGVPAPGAAPAGAPAAEADEFGFFAMPQPEPEPEPSPVDQQVTAPVQRVSADPSGSFDPVDAAAAAAARFFDTAPEPDVDEPEPAQVPQRVPAGYELPLAVPYEPAPEAPAAEEEALAPEEVNGVFLDAFFSELARCGVTDYVVSPGSRSTGLAMKAFERFTDVFVHADERGAAFFALGLAKARRRPVAVICTSGTAPANWMPAVLEAEASRVPLLLLSADRPAQLQHVGAPQTCDQLKLFGDHVKKFVQMPQPASDAATLAYVRQIALEACIAAHGAAPGRASCDAGPVHLNFPFAEPLLAAAKARPDQVNPLPPTVVPGQGILPADARGIFGTFHGKRAIAVCGEGTCNSPEDAAVLLEFARKRRVPLLADPMSGLRNLDDPIIIDNYDTICTGQAPRADVVIRFGRWPVSKRLTQAIAQMNATQIAVDLRDTRDFTASTALFVRALPVVFAAAMRDAALKGSADQAACAEWVVANDAAAQAIEGSVARPDDGFEGAYVARLMDLVPRDSLLFCANSLSVRMVDTYYRRAEKNLRVLCNRGLNGIDGTLSAAVGAAQAFPQTTLLTGDLALLHDANALAFQNEMRIREMRGDGAAPSLVVVCLNNNGGGIFDMLPQKSDADYFGRLFTTPQNVELRFLAQAFGVPYRRASTLEDFRRCYKLFLGQPGINLIDVTVPQGGLAERFAQVWS